MTKDYAKYRSPHPSRRSRSKPKSSSSFVTTSIIVALCFGLGLGFGGSWLANNSEDKNFFDKKETQELVKKQAISTKPRMRAEIEEIPPARFDFYTLLPNMEVEGEEASSSQSAVATATTPTATSPATAQAQIQTAPLQTTAPAVSTAQSTTIAAPAGQLTGLAAAPQGGPASPALQQALSPSTSAKSSNPSDLKLAFVIQAGSFKNQAAAEKLKAKLAFKGLQSKIETTPAQNGDIWYRVVIGPLASQAEAKSIQTDLQNTEKLNSLVLRVRV